MPLSTSLEREMGLLAQVLEDPLKFYQQMINNSGKDYEPLSVLQFRILRVVACSS